MKRHILLFAYLVLLLTINSTKLMASKLEKLCVSKNNRVLMTTSKKPFFPIADTAWEMAWKLNKEEILNYLDIRKEQKFNVINIVAFPEEKPVANVYGKQPFKIVKGQYDPLQPITEKSEYDYWDHLDFIISSAREKGLYVVLLPAWGSRIAGDWGDGHPTKYIIFDVNNVGKYARWISDRYKKYNNIIWMVGGDRSAIYGKYDYRAVFRKMAEGILSGNPNRPLLIGYHPRKWKPNSSEWFHKDSWLSFNSIQDQCSDQIKAITHDWNLKPTKPTWLFEGGYEERGKSAAIHEVKSKRENIYNDWQVRFQAYQTVFAGGFGYTYGHMSIWDFLKDWKTKVQAPGANDMRHLSSLMSSLTDKQFFSLVPDQSLIDGDTGTFFGNEGMFSSCIVAIRTESKDFAMIYTANGSNIRLKMDKFATPTTKVHLRARWFDPRNGKWILINDKIVKTKDKQIEEFNPPGESGNENDWVLVVDLVI